MNSREDESDEDLERLLEDVYELLREQVLDSLFRVERLENLCGLNTDPESIKRLPPLRNRAEIDLALDDLKTRITILEKHTGG